MSEQHTDPAPRVPSGPLTAPAILSRKIWVTHREPGFHNWPDAPEGREYLAADHRHLFGFRVEMAVAHDNREVEFHDLIDHVAELAPAVILAGGSCEMMAQRMGDELVGAYDRQVEVTVDEDGEAGATITMTPDVPF